MEQLRGKGLGAGARLQGRCAVFMGLYLQDNAEQTGAHDSPEELPKAKKSRNKIEQDRMRACLPVK